MPTRNVVLTQHHEEIIDELVKSGRYQNASEVLREGLRLIERRERLEAARVEALKVAAQQGFADLDQGRYTDVSDDDLDDFISALGREAEVQLGKSDDG
ncbi:type II toxin-antitoxin system ParD family antitoxin [Agrobacterium salinitolerans]|jgi:antitoxin ParD1/3/4|uniref:Type II toxin-antitoxin system ParD family antitoxin n=1 Tax=Agrobacterium salinitolerans TaxID=1183413 RepID=A0A9X3KKS0_9HYPH|nr:type II toxin-antitoxin system ParD family antitoxin [Agrobacterium salinitolerans]MBA4776915.1 type II toxin-antitoxin system ParD family antitoxin [Hyphomicrobiales bacterium]MCZ7855518.1 type II toxin-antitoxin system ParD family antitoxin [Agrobacterium salinitolerans]MCZ7936178.1 type II toxin-antitoxin system ParD family antitoxin [Agrobacterium salinitolerans]